jgi:hypothetical protein
VPLCAQFNILLPPGRSVKGIHNSAYKDVVAIASGRERAEQAAKETPAKL